MQQTASRNDVAASSVLAVTKAPGIDNSSKRDSAKQGAVIFAGLLAISALVLMLIIKPLAAAQTPVMLLVFAVGLIALRLQRSTLKREAESAVSAERDQRLAIERMNGAELRARTDQHAA